MLLSKKKKTPSFRAAWLWTTHSLLAAVSSVHEVALDPSPSFPPTRLSSGFFPKKKKKKKGFFSGSMAMDNLQPTRRAAAGSSVHEVPPQSLAFLPSHSPQHMLLFCLPFWAAWLWTTHRQSRLLQSLRSKRSTSFRRSVASPKPWPSCLPPDLFHGPFTVSAFEVSWTLALLGALTLPFEVLPGPFLSLFFCGSLL